MKIICPICKNKTTWEENPWRPFCSERCKLVDLDKWITEEYRVESKEPIINGKNTQSQEPKTKAES